jgi:hypothetical protein
VLPEPNKSGVHERADKLTRDAKRHMAAAKRLRNDETSD